MTLAQAHARFPLVPIHLVEWALANIENPRDIERALSRLEQTKRLRIRYAAA